MKHRQVKSGRVKSATYVLKDSNYILIKGQKRPVKIHDYRHDYTPRPEVIRIDYLTPRPKPAPTLDDLAPRTKRTKKEFLHLVKYSNVLTDNVNDLKKYASLIDTPLIIYDFNSSLRQFKHASNVIYYGHQYEQQNINNIIERRAERQQNKAQNVTIILNALTDYKRINLNYILRRGKIAQVNIIALADDPPKNATFDFIICNKVLTDTGTGERFAV